MLADQLLNPLALIKAHVQCSQTGPSTQQPSCDAAPVRAAQDSRRSSSAAAPPASVPYIARRSRRSSAASHLASVNTCSDPAAGCCCCCDAIAAADCRPCPESKSANEDATSTQIETWQLGVKVAAVGLLAASQQKVDGRCCRHRRRQHTAPSVRRRSRHRGRLLLATCTRHCIQLPAHPNRASPVWVDSADAEPGQRLPARADQLNWRREELKRDAILASCDRWRAASHAQRRRSGAARVCGAVCLPLLAPDMKVTCQPLHLCLL